MGWFGLVAFTALTDKSSAFNFFNLFNMVQIGSRSTVLTSYHFITTLQSQKNCHADLRLAKLQICYHRTDYFRTSYKQFALITALKLVKSKRTFPKSVHMVGIGVWIFLDSKNSCKFLLQRNPSEVLNKKRFLEKFAKITANHLCGSVFFNKVAGLRRATLLKRRRSGVVL